jgi:uncharacterized membrane protein
VIVIAIILVMMMMMMIMMIIVIVIVVIIMIIHYSTLDLLGIEFHYFFMYDTSNLITQVMSLKIDVTRCSLLFFSLLYFLNSSFNINFLK